MAIMYKLHIITLNWNGKDKLKELYPSLINSLSAIDYQSHIGPITPMMAPNY